MQIDLNKYHRIIPVVKSWMEYYPNATDHELVDTITMITQCPLIVIAYLIAHHKGMTPELQKDIDSFAKFYDYDKVILLGE